MFSILSIICIKAHPISGGLCLLRRLKNWVGLSVQKLDAGVGAKWL